MPPRTGRPPKGIESRTERLNIRVTKGEYEKIQECADKIKSSRIDAIIRGIYLLEAELNKK